MAGGSHTDPIVISANSTTQVSVVGDSTVTLKWYKIAATPQKALTVSLTVAGGGPYQVGVWVYRQNGALAQAAAGASAPYTLGPVNEDIYLAVMGPSAGTDGLFGATPGTAIPADVVLTLESEALVIGEDIIYPIPITSLPFTYTVPAGYPAADVYFCPPVGVDEEGAFLFVSTLGSSVTESTGLSVLYPTGSNPPWGVSREIPVSRGGLQQMSASGASPLPDDIRFRVCTPGTVPEGFEITFDLRTGVQVQGTVLDSSGAPAERAVLLISRYAADPWSMYIVGATTSDPVTGEYVFSSDIWNGEYVAVALDTADGNDVVSRFIVDDSIDDPYAEP